MQTLSYESIDRARPLLPAYACESLSSIGSTMLMTGIFFYTKEYYRWDLKQNFMLAAAEGVFYVIGSLVSQHLAAKLGRRRLLIAAFLILTMVAALALTVTTPLVMAAVLVVYTFFSSLVWPAMESIVASGADAHEMSRRIGTYNLVWSGTNAVTYGVCGWIIANWPGGLFALPAAAAFVSGVLMWLSPGIEPPASDPTNVAPAHAEPEPELLARRTLALWLSRISLPATYVIIFSMSAMMPSLPVMHGLGTEWRTAVGCTWMVARFLTFAILTATIWWHTRPKILLLAAFVMLLAFLGVACVANLPMMLASQVILGAVLGVIYCGSLYFGMVLSEGSTEHGGYHEALIGVGSVLGPGTAALTQWQWPGSLGAGVAAVACIVALTLAAATVATVKATKRSTS